MSVRLRDAVETTDLKMLGQSVLTLPTFYFSKLSTISFFGKLMVLQCIKIAIIYLKVLSILLVFLQSMPSVLSTSSNFQRMAD